MRVYISGFYRGHSSKDDSNKIYHIIQLTELDFEPKFNKTLDDDDDDDDLFFRTPTAKNSSEKSSTSLKKKHNLSFSESSESLETSLSETSISSMLQEKKIKKKSKKKVKTTPTNNKSAKLELSTTSQTDVDNKSSINTFKQPPQYNPYFNPNLSSPSYYYPHYYHPPPHDFNRNSENLQVSDNKSTSLISIESNYSTSEKVDVINPKDRKVQFNLPNEDLQQNNNEECIVIESLDDKKNTRSKRTRGRKNQKNNPPLRKSPRKKGGILDIAVSKIIEIDDDDVPQKSDTSFMDTKSDYQIQNDEDVNNDKVSD